MYASQTVDYNLKESISDEAEVTSPNKICFKRSADEVFAEIGVNSATADDPTAQLSGNKIKKVIKVEKD